MLIISVDFDKTVVTDRFPEVGLDAPYAAEVLKKWTDTGKVKIILLTMRAHDAYYDPTSGTAIKGTSAEHPSILQDAINWYSRHNIPLWDVNKNPTQWRWSSSRKVYRHLDIDDNNAGCPMTIHPISGEEVVDWKAIDKIIEEKVSENG